ncbi:MULTISPECIES: tetratricopeptide repeat protein [unclassified Hydrogenobaculum]|uniref:tetratricopeptide repeat protein n=1 Tax=unclassified Hydrogenobaculum TaxID=2622382 RepID=UPI0001C51C29|nr:MULTISPECIES: tetratricopeptide repeat protein [unclassified Hydrogenobaculum]AEF19819.1 hypothetical protein Hyd3684_1440 [Hydrogenobaculum sp. 3684]AEG47105.1 Tetratricopeptide TPR_1 repeat-containing protein [Hydrogenobaculum sp. SHO]AGG15753.1 Tetratricopeptide TPR_1 repeat-containing protein [Hydrogenobaculum sp. HO]AGH94053.1 hypothetical protein HydSN_1486 [Hydrogenobaculum sp. SN]
MKKNIFFLFLILAFIVSSCSKKPFNNECMSKLYQGDFRLAVFEGHNELIKNPKDPAASLCLGIMSEINGDYQDAVVFLKNSLDNTKNITMMSEAESYLCKVFAMSGDLNKASTHCQNAMKYNPTGDALAIALESEGFLESAKNNYQKAIEFFDEALKHAKSDFIKSDIMALKGLAYYHIGNLDKAKSILEKAQKLAKKSKNHDARAIALLSLGEIARENKDYKDALTLLSEGYQEALEADDSYWESMAYAYLGFYYKDMNDPIKARAYIQGAIEYLNQIHADKEVQYLQSWLNGLQ